MRFNILKLNREIIVPFFCLTKKRDFQIFPLGSQPHTYDRTIATETCISEQTVNSLCFSLLKDDLPNDVQYMFSSNQCYTKVNCISFNRMHTLKSCQTSQQNKSFRTLPLPSRKKQKGFFSFFLWQNKVNKREFWLLLYMPTQRKSHMGPAMCTNRDSDSRNRKNSIWVHISWLLSSKLRIAQDFG